MKYKMRDYVRIIICFCLLTIATTIFIFFNKNYKKTASKIVDFDNKNVDSIYLRVTDLYDKENQKRLSEFFEESDSLIRMKNFSKIINEEFNLLELDTQSLLLEDEFYYKDEFREDYGTNFLEEEDFVTLKSIQIGRNAYNFFSLENYIDDGKGFENRDFMFDNNVIPAILGHGYISKVDKGDIIKFNYLTKNVSIKIIGFFKKNTFVGINNEIHFLDNQILIPSLEIYSDPKNKEDEKFQKILYSLKNWGYIKINNGEDYYDYKDKVDRISNDLNLKYVLNEGFVAPYINNISNTMNSSKGIFLIVSIFLFVLLAAIFTYIYIWSFNKNKRKYAIHLICGCSTLRLKLKIYLEIFIQFMLSFSLSFLINKLLLRQDGVYLSELIVLKEAINETLLLSIGVMLMIYFILNIYFNRSDIYSSIESEF